jgi:hypothetical protein
MHWLDPEFLPEVTGVFARFLMNPHGEADGLILTDGTEVHFPPHLSDEIRAAVPAREPSKITIRGVRPRGADMVAAVAIETADGKRIVDNGPPKKHDKHEKPERTTPKPKRTPMQVESTVRRALHGPKGELRGALLEDGTIVRFAPHEGQRLAQLLSPGRSIAIRGEGLTSELGTVIEAQQAGLSANGLQPLKPKQPKHEKPSDRRPDPLAL